MKINPNTYRHSWMGQNKTIGNLRIDELILPGSHDSAMDKLAPNGQKLQQEVTQDVSPIEQIRQGIRVLDLRVWFDDSYPEGDPRRFQLFHMSYSGRTIATDILEPLDQFYYGVNTPDDTGKEIVILDFHQLENFTLAAHRELQALIRSRLGQRMISYDLKDKSLIYLWLNHPGKTVVVAYYGTQGYEFWNSVKQRWSGSNTNTTYSLKQFMDQVTQEYKPDHELRSIQCAKYVLPLFVPDDFSDKIDLWFKSEDENSYIQKFFIINTDWSLRSDIVRNCIHANLIRALNK
jgi:hypothetical protein